MVYNLTLLGHVPSKKNRYRANGKGGLFIDKRIAAQLVPLQLQAQGAWKHGPLKNPGITVTFHTSNDAQDRDGMLVSLMDLLQDAGVLINDNIRVSNGPVLINPAVLCKPGEEKTELRFVTDWETEIAA